MSGSTPASGFAGLRQAIADLVAVVQLAARLVRTLAPLHAQVQELREAVRDLEGAAAVPVPAEPPPRPAAIPSAAAEPNGVTSSRTNGEQPPSPNERDREALDARPTRLISVVIQTEHRQPDLVRLRNALASLPLQAEPALASYTAGRVVFVLETTRCPRTLDVAASLTEALGTGVNGEWLSETEFRAAVPLEEDTEPGG